MTELSRVTPFSEGSVKGFLHKPADATGASLVLTHGAGGNSKAPLLVCVAEAFCAAGLWVLRCDLPFRQRRPFGPPAPATAAEDRAGLMDAIRAMRDVAAGAIFAGGHSYGGRQASILTAEQPGCCNALLLLSYPLHPPQKPNQLRTSHFAALQTPALFIHGTNDPFGSIEEMDTAVRLIPKRTALVPVAGAGHDLSRGNFDVSTLVVREFLKLRNSP